MSLLQLEQDGNVSIMNNFMLDNSYVTSDLHFGHPLVSRLRGYENTNDHDDKIIEELYALPDNATLMILGDISVRKDAYALDILRGIKKAKNFKMLLTPGNHDMVHPMFTNKMDIWDSAYREVFDMISIGFFYRHDRKKLYFTHYPELGSKAVDSKTENAKNYCWFTNPGFDVVIHGHTHSNVAVKDNHINVALEAHNMKPVSVSRLREMIDKI